MLRLFIDHIEICSFRKFFVDASTVQDAEENFGIDQYSDVTMVTKPVVYMTVQEIIDTHQVNCRFYDFMLVTVGRTFSTEICANDGI